MTRRRAHLVRPAVLTVCATSIAGMIVTSIADEPDAAIAFGLVAASAVTTLLAVTAVTAGDGAAAPLDPTIDDLGASIETDITMLAAAGHDEEALRSLAGRAVRLGRLLSEADARS